jgi:hypothetical protein
MHYTFNLGKQQMVRASRERSFAFHINSSRRLR